MNCAVVAWQSNAQILARKTFSKGRNGQEHGHVEISLGESHANFSEATVLNMKMLN
jgi:hypothetical protein